MAIGPYVEIMAHKYRVAIPRQDMGYRVTEVSYMKILLVILFVITAIFNISSAGDKTLTTDAEITYILKLKYAEIKFSVDRKYYLIGDTVMLTTEIKGLTDKNILVFDPCNLMPEHYFLSNTELYPVIWGLLITKENMGFLD
jgi:hypothetical protein